MRILILTLICIAISAPPVQSQSTLSTSDSLVAPIYPGAVYEPYLFMPESGTRYTTFYSADSLSQVKSFYDRQIGKMSRDAACKYCYLRAVISRKEVQNLLRKRGMKDSDNLMALTPPEAVVRLQGRLDEPNEAIAQVLIDLRTARGYTLEENEDELNALLKSFERIQHRYFPRTFVAYGQDRISTSLNISRSLAEQLYDRYIKRPGAEIMTVGPRIESLIRNGNNKEAETLRSGMLAPYQQMAQALHPFAYKTLILIDKQPGHWAF